MGEFVEHSLEGLLPTFEQLSYVQLFSESEVNAFIKRCRQFEYRLMKHEKTPRDFNLYADYLCDFLKLLKCRRTKLQYWEKKKLIDDPLRKKVASIYRRAADRFQGDLRLWEQLIHFLDENSMRRELSAAYTRALQIHGKNEKLRRDFALWQFFSASSPQNARTQILTSLRLLPQSSMLYVAFFTIEIHFVHKVLKRRKYLLKVEGDESSEPDGADRDRVYDGNVDDTIMNLDVAKAVVEQALSAVPSSAASGMLVEMWNECNKVEIPNIDKVRSFIVDKLEQFDNEDTRLFEIESAENNGKSMFELYEEALKKTPTERMHRLYLQWLRDSQQKDAYVEVKIHEVYRGLCDGGWMNDKDWKEMERIIHDFPDEFDTDCIAKYVEKRPQSAVIWDVYLEKHVDNASISADDFRELCNQALEKVDPEENYPIWQHAIDYTIMHSPKDTEQTFKDALKYANASVASRIKILFVEYLNELFDEGKITAERLRERVMDLVNSKPNRSEFYCALYRKEMERPTPDTKFAGYVIKTAVMEKDGVSVEAVILYGEWALKNDLTKFHVIHQMGLKLFEGPELDEFLVQWTHLVQNAASKGKDNAEEVDGEDETIEDATPVRKKGECQCNCEKSRNEKKMNLRKRKAKRRNSEEGEKLLRAD
uniref:U3 small nucleolar RNA-associated protein 6-like protein n=1 Tax=Haemonchus contortus TaxID=6289 RepID=A0A7I4YPY3_HAECO